MHHPKLLYQSGGAIASVKISFAADDSFKFCCFFKNNKQGMVFHENRLLADDSHEISYLIFFSKIKKDVVKIVVCCSHDWRFKG